MILTVSQIRTIAENVAEVEEGEVEIRVNENDDLEFLFRYPSGLVPTLPPGPYPVWLI